MYHIFIGDLTDINLQMHAGLQLFLVNQSDELLPILRGNNTMSPCVYFVEFSGITGRTTSYKNPLADLS